MPGKVNPAGAAWWWFWALALAVGMASVGLGVVLGLIYFVRYLRTLG